MAQKRKSLKKSFRKSNRSTRRKSKTNKRKSRRTRGGGEGDILLAKVGKITGYFDKLGKSNSDNVTLKKEIKTLVNEIITHNSNCWTDGCKENTAKAYAFLQLHLNGDSNENKINSVYETETDKLNEIKTQLAEKIKNQ